MFGMVFYGYRCFINRVRQMVKIKTSAGDHHYADHHTHGAALASVLSFTKVLKVTAISGCSYGIGFLLSYLLLRYLNIVQYGDVMCAKQVLLVVSTVLLMGTKNVSKRFLITYLHDGSPRYKDFIWWHFSYLMRLLLGFSVLYSLSVLVFIFLESVGYVDFHHFHIAYWSLSSAPFGAFAMILAIYLLSFGYVVLYDFAVQVLQNVLWVLLIAYWMFWAPLPSGWDLILFLVVQSVLFFVVLLGFCAVILRDPVRQVLGLSDGLFVDGQWQHHRFASLLIDLYSSLPVMITLLALEIFGASEHAVGHFSLAISLTSLFYIVPSAIYPLIFSHLDHLVRMQGKDEDALWLLRRANRIVLLIMLMIFAVFMFFGHTILQLFVSDSSSMYVLLLLFSGLSMLGGLYYPMLNFALISQGDSSYIGMIDLAIYVALLCFIPVIASYVGSIYCAYFYAAVLFIQFMLTNQRFRQKSGFFIFQL